MLPSPFPCFASCCARERGGGSPPYQLSRQDQPQPAPSSLLLGDKGVAVQRAAPRPCWDTDPCAQPPVLLATSGRPHRKARATGGVQRHHPKERRSSWTTPFWLGDTVMARFLGGGAFRVADPRHTNTTSAAARGEEDAVGKKRNHKA